jgi:hypothetical protein
MADHYIVILSNKTALFLTESSFKVIIIKKRQLLKSLSKPTNRE